MDEQTFTQQGRWTAIALLAACLATSGCATMMKGAIPASQLPPELMAQAHCPRTPIDFTLLRQPPPPSYLVGPRDILGIYIQDILGRSDEPPPVFALVQAPNSSDAPLAVGNPVTVADDGTIILPRIPPMRVAGLTIPQIDAAIRRAYTMGLGFTAGTGSGDGHTDPETAAPIDGHPRRLACGASHPQAARRYVNRPSGDHHLDRTTQFRKRRAARFEPDRRVAG